MNTANVSFDLSATAEQKAKINNILVEGARFIDGSSRVNTRISLRHNYQRLGYVHIDGTSIWDDAERGFVPVSDIAGVCDAIDAMREQFGNIPVALAVHRSNRELADDGVGKFTTEFKL